MEGYHPQQNADLCSSCVGTLVPPLTWFIAPPSFIKKEEEEQQHKSCEQRTTYFQSLLFPRLDLATARLKHPHCASAHACVSLRVCVLVCCIPPFLFLTFRVQ